MGSCQILRPIKSSTKSNLSNRGESTRNSQSVTSSETFFLTQIFQELCTRNHSSKSLEKNIFLIFFSFRGLLGERIFDFYDKDKDGYINQDEFLSIVEKFTKSPVEEVSKDLFLITDLKSDSLIDSEEFLKIFDPVLQEILENQGKYIKNIKNPVFSHTFSSKTEFYGSTYCSMTSMTDHLWRGTSEDFIQKVFQRYEQGMTLNDFSLFLQSSELILKELREAMRYESWVGGLHMKIKMSKNVKDSKPSTLTTSALLTINKKQSPVFLLTQENFLVLVTQKREIFNVLLVDACQLKRSGKTLKLFYFTHFEERLRLDFESEEICETFTENLKISGNLKDFQDFYKLSSRIGSGKFSIVYEAIEISSGLKWAVKVVKKKQLTRFEREMIRKEAEIARYLNRPGIIHVREVFESRKSLKIVMEFAEGGDMTKWFSGPPLPEDLIKKTLKQVLEAVDYLHSHAIMHRDLKPENILISEENWKISIIDFGLSSFFLPGECKKFKCGTLGYMAPEVVCGSYNEKVDIWSVGVLAYGCFTGRLPFSGYLDEDVLEMSQNSEPDYSKEKWREYSTGTVEFTKLLLLKDPELRPNCKEALNHPWLRDSE